MSSLTSTDSRNGDNTWFTPLEIIDKLGRFDLDPCSMSFRPFTIAETTIEHDKGQCGLSIPWKGRVFVNPPYGNEMSPFIDKFINEKPDGVMLIFARMGNKDIQKLIKNGAYFLMLRKRIKFISREGIVGNSAGADSCLVSWNKEELESVNLEGVIISGN